MNYVEISNGTLTKRFKAIKPWRMRLDKAARLRRTVGGIDFDMGKLYEVHTYTLRVRHTEPDADFGTIEDLKQLYATNDVIQFTDLYGVQHDAVMFNNATVTPVATVIEGECAYFVVNITLVYLT